MAGPQYQILCHAVGALSILLACIFIVTGICLQVFDPQDDSDNLLPWRTDCIILTVIGVFALIVFIIYFCHVARRNWKVFNVINIRPHYKRKNPAMDEGWHSADKQGHTSADTEGIDGYEDVYDTLHYHSNASHTSCLNTPGIYSPLIYQYECNNTYSNLIFNACYLAQYLIFSILH